MATATTDMQRIEKKMDQILLNQEKILAAMGMSEKSRCTPAEREAWANNVILKFRQKQAKKRGHEREKSKGTE